MALLYGSLYQVTGVTGGSIAVTDNTEISSTIKAPTDIYSNRTNGEVSTVKSVLLSNRDTHGPTDFNVADLYVEGWIYIGVEANIQSEEMIVFANSAGTGNIKATFRLNNSRRIQFHASTAVTSNTPTATMTTRLSRRKWYFVRIHSPTGTSATGTIYIYDEYYQLVEQMACTGNWLTQNNQRVHWGFPVNRNSNLNLDYYFGGHWASSTVFQTLGIVRTSLLAARAAGTDTAASWVGNVSTGADRWQNLDDVPPNITDYINAAGSAVGDTYSALLTSLPADATFVLGLSPIPNVWNPVLAAGDFKTRLRSGAATNDSAAYAPQDTPLINFRGGFFGTDIATSSAWTVAAANAIQVGVLNFGNGGAGALNNHRCTFIGAIVWYTTSTGFATPPVVGSPKAVFFDGDDHLDGLTTEASHAEAEALHSIGFGQDIQKVTVFGWVNPIKTGSEYDTFLCGWRSRVSSPLIFQVAARLAYFTDPFEADHRTLQVLCGNGPIGHYRLTNTAISTTHCRPIGPNDIAFVGFEFDFALGGGSVFPPSVRAFTKRHGQDADLQILTLLLQDTPPSVMTTLNDKVFCLGMGDGSGTWGHGDNNEGSGFTFLGSKQKWGIVKNRSLTNQELDWLSQGLDLTALPDQTGVINYYPEGLQDAVGGNDLVWNAGCSAANGFAPSLVLPEPDQTVIDHKLIRRELRRQLLTVHSLPELIAWENRVFTPPNPPVPYIRETYLPGAEILVATNQIQIVGIVQYDVFVPARSGTEYAERMAASIRDVFAPASSLAGFLAIDRSELLPGRVDDVWYFVPVQVNWRTYATSS